MRRLRPLALLTITLLVLGACGRDDTSKQTTATAAATTAPKVSGTVTVYAAQSLSGAFTDVGRAFEKAHPGTKVSFNFAGSSTLVTQLTQGAPADVFASADQPNMDHVEQAGLLAGAPSAFTRNALQIVVAKGNPKAIASLADLARAGVATVLCAENVPCGNYARQTLDKAGVQVTPSSEETSVAGVIGRVQNGEADAGIVYVTDVKADEAVSGVAIPDAQNVVAAYPGATLKAAPNPVGAKAFLDFVESSAGQHVLATYGFLPR